MASESADMAEGGSHHEFGTAATAGFGHDWFRRLFGKGRAPKFLLRVANQVTHGGLAHYPFGKPIAKERRSEALFFV